MFASMTLAATPPDLAMFASISAAYCTFSLVLTVHTTAALCTIAGQFSMRTWIALGTLCLDLVMNTSRTFPTMTPGDLVRTHELRVALEASPAKSSMFTSIADVAVVNQFVVFALFSDSRHH
jgi:hypothetical protein